MATDQNIKNKIFPSEIDTAYGRYIVDWYVPPRNCLFLQFRNLFLTYKCTRKLLLGIYLQLTESSLDDEDLKIFSSVIYEN